ncbi:MAG TPA: VWA domain-containing protein [Noviherbaspirillum sp.]
MNALHFAWPLLLLALPLPWLLRLACPPVAPATALRMPRLPDVSLTGSAPRHALPLAAAMLAWLLLVVAAARPQMPAEAPAQPGSGRDLMLAFDVSMSMATADMRHGGQTIDRLQAARLLAGDFLARRNGDRVGLVVFGSQAYLHTPLTFDVQAVRMALGAAETGLAGRETALGDAIALATRHLRATPQSERVLVLLTDGANTAGTLAPERAVWLAQRDGVRIHVIGIGAASQQEDVVLHDISARTGGLYRRAADSNGIARLLEEIDRLEPPARAVAGPPPMRELYAWPLSLALALVVALALLRAREVTA